MIKLKTFIVHLVVLLCLAFLSLPCLAKDSLDGFMTKEQVKNLQSLAFKNGKFREYKKLCDTFDVPKLPGNDLVKEYCLKTFIHTAKEAEKIAEELTKAAKMDNPYAYYLSGIMVEKYQLADPLPLYSYAELKGVEQAQFKHVFWKHQKSGFSPSVLESLGKAIENGSHEAEILLSFYYSNPNTEHFNSNIAFELIKNSVLHGNLTALMRLVSVGTSPGPLDKQKEAILLLQKIKSKAEAGDSMHFIAVGRIYETGILGETSKLKAAQWYKRAGEMGSLPAAVMLENLLFPEKPDS